MSILELMDSSIQEKVKDQRFFIYEEANKKLLEFENMVEKPELDSKTKWQVNYHKCKNILHDLWHGHAYWEAKYVVKKQQEEKLFIYKNKKNNPFVNYDVDYGGFLEEFCYLKNTVEKYEKLIEKIEKNKNNTYLEDCDKFCVFSNIGLYDLNNTVEQVKKDIYNDYFSKFKLDFIIYDEPFLDEERIEKFLRN